MITRCQFEKIASALQLKLETNGPNMETNSKTQFNLLDLADKRSLSPKDLHPKVRSSVLKILTRRLSLCQKNLSTQDNPKEEDGEDAVITLIILEYFLWIGYRHSASVFRKESRMSDCSSTSQIKRMFTFIEGKLGESDLPLLLRLIAATRNQKQVL